MSISPAPTISLTFSSPSDLARQVIQECTELRRAINLIDLTVLGSGAPTNATYVCMTNNTSLTAERKLEAGNGITFTDAGPNSTMTVAFDPSATITVDGNWQIGDGLGAGLLTVKDEAMLFDAEFLVEGGANDWHVGQNTGTYAYTLMIRRPGATGYMIFGENLGGGSYDVVNLTLYGNLDGLSSITGRNAGGAFGIYGGAASGDDLIIGSTTNPTPGTVKIGLSGDTLGFFDGTGAVRQAVTDPVALTGTTATDISNLHSKLTDLINALQAYNLV
jgi:hypothetical protein